MSKNIYEIALLGRIKWDLHSLNNEGNIGNVIEPRTLKLADGSTTDGISGEMLKHVHATKIWELTADKSQLCAMCQILEPARADRNQKVTQFGKGQEGEATAEAIKDCILCDLHGYLVQRPSVHRKSTLEFGWAVGLPDQHHRAIHQHARHAVGYKGEGSQTTPDTETTDDEENEEGGTQREKTTQMVYNRPTRSGVYALISVLQPWRIGLNTIDYTYAIDETKRKERYKVALQAYEAMLLRTTGAMTSTRLPHLEDISGVVIVSRGNFPVPVISPLKDGYDSRAKQIAEASSTEHFEVYQFDDMVSLLVKLRKLTNEAPYNMNMTPEN